jgi:nicotinate phosphoribosyltransferase
MTDPGRKRLVRYTDAAGRFIADIIRLADEPPDADECSGPVPFVERHDVSYLRGIDGWTGCQDLLQVVMHEGRRVAPSPPLEEVRARARAQIAALPEEVRRLRNPEYYTVGLSPTLAAERLRLAGQAPGVIAPGPVPPVESRTPRISR